MEIWDRTIQYQQSMIWWLSTVFPIQSGNSGTTRHTSMGMATKPWFPTPTMLDANSNLSSEPVSHVMHSWFEIIFMRLWYLFDGVLLHLLRHLRLPVINEVHIEWSGTHRKPCTQFYDPFPLLFSYCSSSQKVEGNFELPPSQKFSAAAHRPSWQLCPLAAPNALVTDARAYHTLLEKSLYINTAFPPRAAARYPLCAANSQCSAARGGGSAYSAGQGAIFACLLRTTVCATSPVGRAAAGDNVGGGDRRRRALLAT